MRAETPVDVIEIIDDTIVLTRKSVLNSAETKRVLRISDLAGIDFRAATASKGGVLRFIHSGVSPSLSQITSLTDKDSIAFLPEDQPQFRRVYDCIMSKMVGDSYVAEDHSASDAKVIEEKLKADQDYKSIATWGCAGWIIIILAYAFLS